MLVCPPHVPLHCMPLPIKSHQRNKYRVKIKNGVKCLEQILVRHEDFAIPSTGEQTCPQAAAGSGEVGYVLFI